MIGPITPELHRGVDEYLGSGNADAQSRAAWPGQSIVDRSTAAGDAFRGALMPPTRMGVEPWGRRRRGCLERRPATDGSAQLEEYARDPFCYEPVDLDEHLAALREAVEARNAWKRILARCAAGVAGPPSAMN